MKATYNEKKRQFNLIYFDAVKELNGHPYPHTRLQETWKGEKKPTQKQIKQKIAEFELKGETLQKERELEAARLKQNNDIVETNTTDEVTAIHYFNKVQLKNISKSKNKEVLKNIERILNNFKEWIKENYTLITMTDIKRSHIKEYFETLTDYCEGIQTTYYTYIKKVFKNFVNEMEEKNQKAFNPFNRLTVAEVLNKKKKEMKIGFTIEEIKAILNIYTNNEKNKGILAEQTVAILYFLIVTGWRVGDIVALKWEQIDLKNRIITLNHKKTNQETKIYITPLMMTILERMKENLKEYSINKHLVFGFRGMTIKVNNFKSYKQKLNEKLNKIVNEMGILKTRTTSFGYELNNYTIHCFRKSLITELTLGNFNKQKIDYMVGHENKTVDTEHYLHLLTYPERTTRKMIEHMEEQCELKYFWLKVTKNTIEATRELYKLNKWLKKSVIEDMKNNFWNDEAINKLEELYNNGVNIVLIEMMIALCNKLRTETGEEEVTLKMVEDFYELSKIFNFEHDMKKQLE